MKINLSIFHVFLLSALVTLIGVAGLAFVSANEMRNTMLNDRQDKVQQTRLFVNQPGLWARLSSLCLKIRRGNSGACEFG
mgnify:CR=1 FL=1